MARLDDYLRRVEQGRTEHLSPLLDRLRREATVPEGTVWEKAWLFLNTLINGLTPKLREVLALRGIRFYEMEILDRYTIEIPQGAHVAIALRDAGRQAIEQMKASPPEGRAEREQAVRDLMTCNASFASRISLRLQDIDKTLQDMRAFVPLWLDSIHKRRALLLRRIQREDDRQAERAKSPKADDPGRDPLHDTRPIDTRRLI